MSGDNNRLLPFTDEALDALIARAAKSDGRPGQRGESARYERIESRVLNQSLPPQDAQTPRKSAQHPSVSCGASMR